TSSFMTRMLHNTSKVYSGQLESGEPFSHIRPVYALCLVNETYLPKDEDYLHHYSFNDGKPNGHKISGIEITAVELPKFKSETFSEKKMQVLWLRFLTEIKAGDQIIPEGLNQSKELQKAIEVLEKSSYTAAELASYHKFWDAVRVEVSIQDDAKAEGKAEGLVEGLAEGEAIGMKKGKAEGEAIGMKKGKVEGKVEMARSLLQAGVDIAIIVQSSGLTEAEIKEIR
ncbi:MAG: Rpn family recombination-promoting nuclease/putative transposase, partial [Mangrovibacterium sp.]